MVGTSAGQESRAGRRFKHFGEPLTCGPGTKMRAKDWGHENWRDLLRRIVARYPGYCLVIVGAKEDSAVGDYVLGD